MEARLYRAALMAAALVSLGASHRTPNFVITAPTQAIAQQVGQAAEEYRRDLAIEWLGEAMPNWSRPCPITVQVAPNLGAGGETSFVFDRGEVYGWQMRVQGTLERVIDSVLPHEVTHTIFASHFRQPLPRWADEGACTTVEHAVERRKHQKMLIEFLKTGRGISFSEMFAMTNYPHDVYPLYAQGHSVSSFLLEQGGKPTYVAFVAEGLEGGQWTKALETHYGFANLSQFQDTWLNWVRVGSPVPVPMEYAPRVAATSALASTRRGDSDLVVRAQSEDRHTDALGRATHDDPRNTAGQLVPIAASNVVAAADVDAGWQPAAIERGGAPLAVPDNAQNAAMNVAASLVIDDRGPPRGVAAQWQPGMPPPVQRPRVVLVEWQRNHADGGEAAIASTPSPAAQPSAAFDVASNTARPASFEASSGARGSIYDASRITDRGILR